MASEQKEIMGMARPSPNIIGRRNVIEESKNYPKRSYCCNLYLQI